MALTAKQAADAILARARQLVNLSGNLTAALRDDVLRQAVVYGEAALDTYLHKAILEEASVHWQAGVLPKALKKLDVPFDDLAVLAEHEIDARQRQVDARPWVTVKNMLMKRLMKDTFQSSSSVESAMTMLGIEKAWSSLAAAMGESLDDIKKQLNNIALRRNQIAHEGDIERGSRPRGIRHNAIDAAYVTDSLNFLERVINGINGLL